MIILLEIREVDGKPLYRYLSRDRIFVITTRKDPRNDIYHLLFKPPKTFKRTHFLKCIQPFFDDVYNLRKQFESRKDDRDYKEGDYVILQEYDPENNIYSGKIIECKITYLTRDNLYVKEGYCIFGIDIRVRSGTKYANIVQN